MGRRRIPQKLTSARDRAEVISWQSTLKQSVDVSDRDQHRCATVDQPHTWRGCRRRPCAVYPSLNNVATAVVVVGITVGVVRIVVSVVVPVAIRPVAVAVPVVVAMKSSNDGA